MVDHEGPWPRRVTSILLIRVDILSSTQVVEPKSQFVSVGAYVRVARPILISNLPLLLVRSILQNLAWDTQLSFVQNSV